MHAEVMEYRPVIVAPVHMNPKDPLPPRHRNRKRREDDVVANNPQPLQNIVRDPLRGQEFDLEDSAFPPLPGFEAGAMASVSKPTTFTTNAVETIQHNSNADAQMLQTHWGENRLADVVKGTAKTKGSKDNGSGPNSPRAMSPQQNTQGSQTTITKQTSMGNGDLQLCTVTLTPPSSPEK